MPEIETPNPERQRTSTWRVEVRCPNCTQGPAQVHHVEARLWIEAVAAAEKLTGLDRSWLEIRRINR